MKMLDVMQAMMRGEAPAGVPLSFPPPVAKLVGFDVVSFAEGSTVFRMEARRDKHVNPMGTVHGGILCDLADAAMGMACASLLEVGESFTTLELRMNFLRPVFDATLEARAKVVQGGKTMVYVECDVVTTPDEKLVARSSSSCLVLRGAQAKGR